MEKLFEAKAVFLKFLTVLKMLLGSRNEIWIEMQQVDVRSIERISFQDHWDWEILSLLTGPNPVKTETQWSMS